MNKHQMGLQTQFNFYIREGANSKGIGYRYEEPKAWDKEGKVLSLDAND